MAFCGNCGNQIQDGVKFCPSCGQAAGAPQPKEQAQYQPQYQQPSQEQAQYQQAYHQPYQQPYHQPYQQPYQPGYAPPVVPGAPQQSDIRDAQDNKAMAILAYILFFIPLLTGAHKTSVFTRYHTNQGTVLFIAACAWSILYWILTAISTALLLSVASLGLWGVINTILTVLLFVPTVFCIVGIINAANGKMQPLPLIGGITIVK